MTSQKSLYQTEKADRYSFLKLMSMTCLFLYICSIYILSYNPALNFICTLLFGATLGFTVLDAVLSRKAFALDYSFFSLLLFVIYSALTTFWATCDTMVMTTVMTLVQLFVLYFVVRLNIRDEKDLRNILYSIYIGATVMCLYTIAFYGPREIISRIMVGERIGTEINQMNGMGFYCTVLFILTLYYIIFEKKKWAYVMLPISLFVLVGAGSRKAFLLVALAFLLMEMFKSKRGRMLRFLAILAVICLGIYMVMELAETNKFFYRFAQVFNFFGDESRVTDVSISTRSNMIRFGLDLFSEKPLQGYGPMQFEHFYSLIYGMRRAPHSTYIQIAVSFGLIGLFLFYGIYLYVLKRIVPMIRAHRKYSIMILTMVIMFIANDIGGNMLTHKFVYIFMAIYASYCSIKLDSEKKVSLE